jgi:hypothetical protein
MNTGDRRWLLQWRRNSVDVLITATTLAVGAAALGTTADTLYLLMILGAILGLAILLEPNINGQDAHDPGARALELAPIPRLPRLNLQPGGHFHGAPADARNAS